MKKRQSKTNPFNVQPSGVCPVQAEGTLPTGEFYYFRARGSRWSLDVSATEKDWWRRKMIFRHHVTDYATWPDAGWISKRTAIRLATLALRKYVRERKRASTDTIRPT
jgi:hypothetical protein